MPFAAGYGDKSSSTKMLLDDDEDINGAISLSVVGAIAVGVVGAAVRKCSKNKAPAASPTDNAASKAKLSFVTGKQACFTSVQPCVLIESEDESEGEVYESDLDDKYESECEGTPTTSSAATGMLRHQRQNTHPCCLICCAWFAYRQAVDEATVSRRYERSVQLGLTQPCRSTTVGLPLPGQELP